jgi:hypothetical protein
LMQSVRRRITSSRSEPASAPACTARQRQRRRQRRLGKNGSKPMAAFLKWLASHAQQSCAAPSLQLISAQS